MRIWDVDPGYLDRKRLLAEHQELHGLYNVVVLGKKGFANHPETMRWRPNLSALVARHACLVHEMILRGYRHQSPLDRVESPPVWPDGYIDLPFQQFLLLEGKYAGKDVGRIPLPGNTQTLWAQNKYSVMARQPNRVRLIGQAVAEGSIDFKALAAELVLVLRQIPREGHLVNALDHMWGYVSQWDKRPAKPSLLLALIGKLALANQITYLIHSTALGELARFLENQPSDNAVNTL